MTLNRLQRAALIVGLVAIGCQTAYWMSLPRYAWGGGHINGFTLLLAYWAASAAFTIAAMVLVGTRWYKRKKSS